MEQRGVADGIAFAVFEKYAGCGLAGKLRNTVGEIVVLQVAPPEDAMLAVLIELVVELGDVGVSAAALRRGSGTRLCSMYRPA